MKQRYRISRVYVCNPDTAPRQVGSDQPEAGPETQPDYGANPLDDGKPQKKERHWLATAIPAWLGIIAVFALLVWPRQLTGYTAEGKKAVEVNYTLWGGTLDSIEFFDQCGQESGNLRKANEWGSEWFILTETTEQEDTYTEYCFIHGRLCVRYDHQGPLVRKISYDTNGYIVSIEENGQT